MKARGSGSGSVSPRLLVYLAASTGLLLWRNVAQMNVILDDLPDFDPEFDPAPAGHRGPGPAEEFKYLKELSHFFSHIPKSGSEYATEELQRLLQATTRLPGNRTLPGVHRAQSRFNATAYAGDFFTQSRGADAATVRFLGGLTGNVGSDAYAPPAVCNLATTPLKMLPPYRVMKLRATRVPPFPPVRYACAMHTTESPWHAAARRVYTIVREPLSHVLSQYFHCTESPQHLQYETRQGRMPPLDEWLETYVELKESDLDEGARQRRALKLRKQFICYNPIDSESEFAAFDLDHRLPSGYTYPYPDIGDRGERDEGTRLLDRQLFDDLKQKYAVIGDTAQMVKSVCVIFISFAGQVPAVCDCTHQTAGDGDNNGNSSGTFCLHNLHTHPDSAAKSQDREPKCPLRIGYDSQRHSHGVQHHGSSFLEEITPRQRDLIARLRTRDRVLYNVSRAVFAAQVAELEARHGIRVCERWHRHGGTWTVAPARGEGTRVKTWLPGAGGRSRRGKRQKEDNEDDGDHDDHDNERRRRQHKKLQRRQRDDDDDGSNNGD